MTPPIKSYKDITEKLPGLSREDEELIRRAYEFARTAHWGQTRYSGEPYFNHVFETGLILATLGMGPRTIAAGLLHDVIEDTPVTEEDIRKEFGDEILFLVNGVTKLGDIKYRGAKRHAESLRKLFIATSEDIRVLIIKLADRLHNMRTLEYVPKEKQGRIAAETLEVYAPIAHRLGIGRVKGELEDLAFKALYPAEYEETLRIAEERYIQSQTQLDQIHKRLAKQLGKEGIYNVKVDFRRKHIWSLYQKLKRRDMDIEQIHDIMALRVVVANVSDCYRVLGIVHSLWRPLPGRIKDYIAFPKPNGYRSIHTTIFTGEGGIAEIQIRTKKMHQRAEYGIASHARYKHGSKTSASESWLAKIIPHEWMGKAAGTVQDEPEGEEEAAENEREMPTWISDMAEAQKEFQETDELLNTFKGDFFQDRIFVFTPKGDVIDLPAGSTPVDFAYHVHSDIGDRMAGAKINGKLESLDSKLQNGDIVEIMTSNKSKPTAKWLEYAQTLVARRHIRQALNQED